MIYIFTLLILGKLSQARELGLFRTGAGGGGGVANVFSEGVTSLGEVKVFRGVGGNFSEELKQFSMQALIIIS